ncbi:putative methionine--tRNA ligase [Iris pallida]|uniref:Methionine--tRNA ligase n=1 Tax=Iris pallida TaxID=29817 RepID=A0AAX6FHM3_IRIPA|nr:putative methionine--tRNA ligase [Iris pallida]
MTTPKMHGKRWIQMNSHMSCAVCPWLCRLKIEQVTTQFHRVKYFVCWMKEAIKSGLCTCVMS